MLRIVRKADLVWRPWKNGGGVMADIGVSPENADFDRTDWRVSIAKVERDGPFSNFPGMDRGMVLLSGQRLELHVDSRPPLFVDADGATVSFPGDRPTLGVPIGGPIENLNVMARRGVVDHRICRNSVAGQCVIQTVQGGMTFIHVASGRVTSTDEPALCLEAGDTLVTDADMAFTAGTAQLIVINLWPAWCELSSPRSRRRAACAYRRAIST